MLVTSDTVLVLERGELQEQAARTQDEVQRILALRSDGVVGLDQPVRDRLDAQINNGLKIPVPARSTLPEDLGPRTDGHAAHFSAGVPRRARR